MRKYGIEHFHVELIEETNEPEGREKRLMVIFGVFPYLQLQKSIKKFEIF